MAAKRRADQLLVEQGLAESRAKAQALILAGLVSIAGRRVDKPGTALAEDAELIGHCHLAAAKIARQRGIEDGYRTVLNVGPRAGRQEC